MFDVTLISDNTENGIRRTIFQTCALVCSELIDIETVGDTIKSVRFTSGCNGNLQGIGALVAGMKKSDAITRLEGIQCNCRGTSCPDQLARALRKL
ncbi:MAG: TIGR03905 family TSCPD domain-containing protein [Bacteroidaceae bacterium]|nr:TIGR03905 family TSCPD domain-containing protein [Bacteroidaceae bacterium]